MILQTGGRRAASISVLVAATAAGAYVTNIYQRISLVSPSNITTSRDTGEALCKSRTIREIVNPRGYAVYNDGGRAVTLEIPARCRNVSDEVLLAQFVKGFFGGRVFALEALFLKTFGFQWPDFSTLPLIASRPQIWKASDFMEKKLPPLLTVLFGGFTITEVQLQDHPINSAEATESAINIAFGSDQHKFAGAHRFTITRHGSAEKPQQDEPAQITISFASVVCNPISEKGFQISGILAKFHDIYSNFLFRDAVSGMKIWLSTTEEPS